MEIGLQRLGRSAGVGIRRAAGPQPTGALLDFTHSEVADFLDRHNFSQYKTTLASCLGSDLLLMTDAKLEALGVALPRHRARLLVAINIEAGAEQ